MINFCFGNIDLRTILGRECGSLNRNLIIRLIWCIENSMVALIPSTWILFDSKFEKVSKVEWFIEKNVCVIWKTNTHSTRVHVKESPLSFNVFTFLCTFCIVFSFKALALALCCRTDRYLSDTSEWLARCAQHTHTTIPIYKYSFRFVFALFFRAENRSFLRVRCFSECIWAFVYTRKYRVCVKEMKKSEKNRSKYYSFCSFVIRIRMRSVWKCKANSSRNCIRCK